MQTRREKEQVATISAHNNATLGGLVADAIDKVGPDGVVSAEEAKGTETSLEVVEGMQFDRGYMSSYVITNAEKMQAVLDHPVVLLYEKKISIIKDFVPLLEEIAKTGHSVLIIAENVESEVLAMLVVNKLRGVFSCVAVKAPGCGDNRKAVMEDIAALTGAQFISEDLGKRLDKTTLQDLRRADRVIVDKDSTTIIGGAGDKDRIHTRCKELREQIEATSSGYDRKKLLDRLAKLSGGVAIVRVGAPSEAEMKSHKEALDDGISATKAAVAEGIVPGGGLALLRAIRAVNLMRFP